VGIYKIQESIPGEKIMRGRMLKDEQQISKRVTTDFSDFTEKA